MRPITFFCFISALCCLILSCSPTQRENSSAMSLQLYNPASQQYWMTIAPQGTALKRAEIPYNTTLAVQNSQAKKVVFTFEQAQFEDTAPPFTAPLPKKSTSITVSAYDASGKMLAKSISSLNISEQGMPPPGSELNQQQTIDWLEQNLDKVMKAKTYQASNGLKMPYRLYLPENFDPAVHYPLVVFLHGRGQRGQANEEKIYRDVKLFTGPNSIVAPNSQRAHPSIVLVPQCSDETNTEEWASWNGNSEEHPFKGLGLDGSYPQAAAPSSSGAAALELVEYIAEQYQADRSRIYLTGVSMGGFGTWEFTSRKPNLFAAAVPMAGYSAPETADQIQHIPFWIFHGEQDEYNPVAGSRKMYELLQSRGAQVQYTELKGLKHVESFDYAWTQYPILSWLFAQKQ